jgi:hypothetical protein
MATLTALTLHQANDEIISLNITPVDPTDDMTLVTELRVLLKDSVCDLDTALTTVTLSTTDPTEMVILVQDASHIQAEVYVSAVVLVDAHPLRWRVDAYVGTARRTAGYGPVTVVDL